MQRSMPQQRTTGHEGFGISALRMMVDSKVLMTNLQPIKVWTGTSETVSSKQELEEIPGIVTRTAQT